MNRYKNIWIYITDSKRYVFKYILIFIVIIMMIFFLINKSKNDRNNVVLTPYSWEYIFDNVGNENFTGLREFIEIQSEEPVIVTNDKTKSDEDLSERYTVIKYRIKFKNVTEDPILFYFDLFRNPIFKEKFYDIDQKIQYNFENVKLEPGMHLGVTFVNTVKNTALMDEKEKKYFYDNYKKFIGYFKVDEREFIKKIDVSSK